MLISNTTSMYLWALFNGMQQISESDMFDDDVNEQIKQYNKMHIHALKINGYREVPKLSQEIDGYVDYWPSSVCLTEEQVIQSLTSVFCPSSGRVSFSPSTGTLDSCRPAARRVQIIDRHSHHPSSLFDLIRLTRERLAPILEFEPFHDGPVGRANELQDPSGRSHSSDNVPNPKTIPVDIEMCVNPYYLAGIVTRTILTGRRGCTDDDLQRSMDQWSVERMHIRQESTRPPGRMIDVMGAAQMREPRALPPLPDDVLVKIMRIFIGPSYSLFGSPRMCKRTERGFKCVSRQWYRCWWAAALGSHTPTSLNFGFAVHGENSLYRNIYPSQGGPSPSSRGIPATCEKTLALANTWITGPSFAKWNGVSTRHAPPKLYARAAAKAVPSKARHTLSSVVKRFTKPAPASEEHTGEELVPVPPAVDRLAVLQLDISGVDPCDELVTFFTRAFPNCETLIWNQSEVSDQMLARMITAFPRLTRLSAGYSPNLQTIAKTAEALGNRAIVELAFPGCPFGPEGLALLASACPRVTRLDISSLDYTVPSTTTVLSFVAACELGRASFDFGSKGCFPQLEVLVAPNLTGYDSSRPSSNCIKISPDVAPTLRSLDLSSYADTGYTCLPVACLSHLTALEALHLNGWPNLSDESLTHLAICVEVMPRLRWLSLSSNNAGTTFSTRLLPRLLDSSPGFAPLTLVQLPYHQSCMLTPLDAARHVVWSSSITPQILLNHYYESNQRRIPSPTINPAWPHVLVHEYAMKFAYSIIMKSAADMHQIIDEVRDAICTISNGRYVDPRITYRTVLPTIEPLDRLSYIRRDNNKSWPPR